jgi:hypothetical protein
MDKFELKLIPLRETPAIKSLKYGTREFVKQIPLLDSQSLSSPPSNITPRRIMHIQPSTIQPSEPRQ